MSSAININKIYINLFSSHIKMIQSAHWINCSFLYPAAPLVQFVVEERTLGVIMLRGNKILNPPKECHNSDPRLTHTMGYIVCFPTLHGVPSSFPISHQLHIIPVERYIFNSLYYSSARVAKCSSNVYHHLFIVGWEKGKFEVMYSWLCATVLYQVISVFYVFMNYRTFTNSRCIYFYLSSKKNTNTKPRRVEPSRLSS